MRRGTGERGTAAARLAGLLALAGCGRGPRPELLDGPRLAAFAEAPMSAELTVRTDVPTTLRVELRGAGTDLDLAFPGRARTHVVPLHGTRPDREVRVTVELTAEGGGVRRESTSFRTAPLPPDFPDVDLLRVDRGRVFDGWILCPLRTPDGRGWLVAVDPRDGEVAWRYAGPRSAFDVDLTPRGTVLALSDQGIVELDLLGRERLRLLTRGAEPEPGALPIDAEGLHHEVLEHDGTLVTLAHRSITVPAYPDRYTEPEILGGPARLADVEVVTLDPADGAVLARWPLSERLDPTRIGFDSLAPTADGLDWAHANAVLPFRGGWLVEVRHQDALVSLDAAGDVRWILAAPGGWSDPFRPLLLRGDPQPGWPLHPHGPSVDARGRVVVFDNGNHGHDPYTPDPGTPLRSRVVAWAIDEEARTASVAWTWAPEARLFSGAMGNAAVLPGGDVLADFGLLVGGGDPEVPPGRGSVSARVFQFTPGEDRPSLDLRFSTDGDAFPDGVRLYRAIPVSTLYPAGVRVERR